MNITAENPSVALHIPNTFPRILALLIDGVLVMLAYGVFYLMNQIRFDRTELFLSWISIVGTAVYAIVYQFYFLKKYSQTPGKMLFGLFMVDAKTQQPNLSNRQIALRILGGMLSIPLSLAPQSFALFRPDRRSIQDLIADTQVLRNQPRKSPAKIRWLLGSALTLYFTWSGLTGMIAWKYYSFSREGVSANLLAASMDQRK